MRLFGAAAGSKTKKNDGGLGMMLEQRKFSVISQVILQDPGTAKEILSHEGLLFDFLKHEAPADLMAIVVGVVKDEAFLERDSQGRTPLHVAIQGNCSREIISSLTIKKAAKAKDQNGRVPLHYAVSGKLSNGIIKALLRAAPATINEEDETGSTPLELAEKIDSKIMDLLHDASSALSASMTKSGSRGTLHDESERSRMSGSRHRRRSDKSDLDSGHFTSSSSTSSRDLKSKKGSKELTARNTMSSRDVSKLGRSTSHESLNSRLSAHKSGRSKSSKADVPNLIDPASKPLSFDDSLSTIGTGWEKPALPLTGVEYVERLAQRANS